MVVTLLVEDGALTDIKIAGTGCSISQSSASLMSAAVKGRTLDDVQRLIADLQGDDVHPRDEPWRRRSEHARSVSPRDPKPSPASLSRWTRPSSGELAALQGVVKFPVRIKCATLSWNALAQGLSELAAANPA